MIPKLRFQEFEDSWSQVTIAEAASFRRGSFPQPYNIPQWYDDVNGMPFVQVVDVGNDFRLKPKTKQMISEMAMPKSVFVPKGSIVITIQGSIGRIALTQYDSYVDRTLLIITEKKLPLDDYFFIIALKKIFDYEKTIAVGGTIKTITKEKLAKFKFSLPHRSEQQRIGDFIRLVDQKINLLTKKKEALETYKKGLMQKIFSKELRFKREDGTDYPEWETLRIEDISEERSERGFDDYRLLSITLHNGIVPQELGGKSDSSSSDKSNYKLVKIGDIGYNSMRMWQGASGVSSFEGIVSPAYTVFKLNERADAQYVGYLFKTHRLIGTFKSHSQGLTSDTWNLKYPTLKRIKITLPSIGEQLRVVRILNQFDVNIESFNKRIKATEQLKKGLLQQMFV